MSKVTDAPLMWDDGRWIRERWWHRIRLWQRLTWFREVRVRVLAIDTAEGTIRVGHLRWSWLRWKWVE